MNIKLKSILRIATTAIIVAGCQSQTEPVTSGSIVPATTSESDLHEHSSNTHGDSEVAAEMAKLSPADRKEAEAQKFCVISNGSLLGSMGAPIKLDINGQSVYICCGASTADGCGYPSIKSSLTCSGSCSVDAAVQLCSLSILALQSTGLL